MTEHSFLREWALLVPSWTIVVVILTYIAYSAIAIRLTPAFDDMSAIAGAVHGVFFVRCLLITLLNADSRVALPSKEDATCNPYLSSSNKGSIPELYDIPIGVVNTVLYREALRRTAATRHE